MSNHIANNIHINLKATTPLVGNDPADGVTSTEVVLEGYTGYPDKTVSTAEFVIHIVDPLACATDPAPSVFEMIQGVSISNRGWIGDFYPILYRDHPKAEKLSDAIQNILQRSEIKRFAILDGVYIGPLFRGQQLDLVAVARLLPILARDCDFVVMDADPERKYGNRDDDTATKKLVNHWGRLGFQVIPDHSPYLILTAIEKLPSIATILEGDI